jgi:hypothetical protein
MNKLVVDYMEKIEKIIIWKEIFKLKYLKSQTIIIQWRENMLSQIGLN